MLNTKTVNNQLAFPGVDLQHFAPTSNQKIMNGDKLNRYIDCLKVLCNILNRT
ncbi:hypothetical protein DAT561_p0023 (plasmid) [Melissococcus plutonius]|uniref:Uncharacterized protein n=1 Tax=Melissococcus plutonius TaxID=33970 RepID=A0A2Z5Y4U0_9ENTE|nr:hypothetical protein DAT561_p0023 [Melissococcus plutonius]